MTTSVAQPMPSTKPPAQQAYPDIAVALTETASDRAAVDAAILLASAFGSRVDLLQLLLMPTPLVDSWSLVPDSAFIEAYDTIRDEAKTQAAAWREHLKRAHVPGEVHALESLYIEPSSLAAQAARCRDMVVIGGPDPHDGDAASSRRYFSGLLFETGLPVLVVPHGSEPVLPPRRATVAWADTRECVRAIHDALPLLKGCEAVSVASVKDAYASDPAEPVALLARHGVAAEPIFLKLSGDESTAARIMEHASASHSHLIVAGGYGHTRLREWAIGGVTRELLSYSRIPVLFSH
ncbi:hypothetical protein [Luteibacter sp. CQ10]|uniref:hypothetical protein n=1 Tax=Luteibacter sp. CQ10 TaxID=2805821 RepID=UPI0034A19E3B